MSRNDITLLQIFIWRKWAARKHAWEKALQKTQKQNWLTLIVKVQITKTIKVWQEFQTEIPITYAQLAESRMKLPNSIIVHVQIIPLSRVQNELQRQTYGDCARKETAPLSNAALKSQIIEPTEWWNVCRNTMGMLPNVMQCGRKTLQMPMGSHTLSSFRQIFVTSFLFAFKFHCNENLIFEHLEMKRCQILALRYWIGFFRPLWPLIPFQKKKRHRHALLDSRQFCRRNKWKHWTSNLFDSKKVTMDTF